MRYQLFSYTPAYQPNEYDLYIQPTGNYPGQLIPEPSPSCLILRPASLAGFRFYKSVLNIIFKSRLYSKTNTLTLPAISRTVMKAEEIIRSNRSFYQPLLDECE